MVSDPESQFEAVKAAGGDSVTFHVEVAADPAGTIARARELDLGVGVAFNPETEVGAAVRAAEGADLALCMSIHPGLSGQKFMPEALPRIEELRRSLPDSVHVQVDGGIHADNVRTVRESGADLLVAGSAVFWQEDPAAAYRALTSAIAADVPA
jgi:ribulose-phosphate 3-epimerase